MAVTALEPFGPRFRRRVGNGIMGGPCKLLLFRGKARQWTNFFEKRWRMVDLLFRRSFPFTWERFM